MPRRLPTELGRFYWVDGLQRNSPYDLQIFERCANGADDSSAGEAEQVLWTLPGYWEIHIPPHDASSYVVEDTLEAHAGCEVIKSCCDDQFSLCFSGNESRTVEVQRVDTELGWWQQVGWGQDLYLRCHAPSVAAFKNDPISKELPEPPWYLRLYEPTHVTAQVVFHHGNFIGARLALCRFRFRLWVRDPKSHPVDFDPVISGLFSAHISVPCHGTR
eukprot:s2_g39.t1